MVQSRPDISPTSNNAVEESSLIVSLMHTHKNHSVKAINSATDAPIFTLPRSNGYANDALITALEDYSRSSAMCSLANPTNQVISDAFSLLVSLFGEDKTLRGTKNEARRLEAVSAWLKRVVSGDTKRAIAAAQSSGDIYGSIFAAFSGGDAATASSLALDSGHPRLSLILSNTGVQTQPSCDKQLEMWHASGAQQFTPTSILRILSLSSGKIDIERKIYKSSNESYNIDWRRRFGMYLWSCSHSQNDHASLSSIITQYSSDASAGLAPPATPLYCDKSPYNTKQCILYQVLNHYEDTEMPIANVVAPPSHTQFKHDFSSSFHLSSALTALSRSNISHYQEHLIVDSATSQLITEGSWEWAVYASLCFIGKGVLSDSSASARLLRAKNIIARFYAPSLDTHADSRRSFLQSIGIPPEWFVEAQAYRCASEGDVFGMLDNLMRFSAVDSMTLLERIIIPHILLEGREARKQLWQILDSLRSKISEEDLDCWNKPNGCGLFHQFLELWIQVERLSSMHLDQGHSGDVNIDHLLEIATNMETKISMDAAETLEKSSLPHTMVRYGFTRTPPIVIVGEMKMILSNLRMQLLTINNGLLRLPAHSLDFDSQMSSKFSPQLSFSLSPDSLYAESVIRGMCAFKTMG